MKPTLGLTPDGRWDVEVPSLVESARRAGFSTLGLSAGRVDAQARAAYEAAGLRCHELLALVFSDDEAATISRTAQLAEAAATIGAQWVLTTFQSGLTADTAGLVRRCAAIFADAGAGMAVEFSPLGPVTSIRAGMEVVAAAGPGRAGLMIDSWHFSFGDSTWDDLARVPLEQVAYVQFADALAPVSDNRVRETMHRRALPGRGDPRAGPLRVHPPRKGLGRCRQCRGAQSGTSPVACAGVRPPRPRRRQPILALNRSIGENTGKGRVA